MSSSFVRSVLFVCKVIVMMESGEYFRVFREIGYVC